MANPYDLNGKVIAITGASSGFGHHFAGVLAAAGATVVLGARREEKLEERVAEIQASGGTALACRLDVRDIENHQPDQHSEPVIPAVARPPGTRPHHRRERERQGVKRQE